jgi:hypothetical protein
MGAFGAEFVMRDGTSSPARNLALERADDNSMPSSCPKAISFANDGSRERQGLEGDDLAASVAFCLSFERLQSFLELADECPAFQERRFSTRF